ncbi:MAG TPA: protein-export chaperone SecB [Desulfobacterales bacterium]|nr:protein-export chaperone SecB [Desulfobacterales bacterium]
MSEKKEFIKLHAIQLGSVSVIELYIRANQFPDASIKLDLDDAPLLVGHSEYDPESKSIQVSVKTEIGMEKDKGTTPYSMRVELVGDFIVDEDEFPIAQIDDWAVRNAPMILQPYLREHVFALTARAGFYPLILPLIEVPTLVSKRQEVIDAES